MEETIDMHFKNLLLFLCVIFCFSKGRTQDSPAVKQVKDSIIVTEIQMEKDRSKGLTGLKIILVLDKKLSFGHNLNIHYSLEGKPYTREYREMRPTSLKEIIIFHPFAILYKVQGQYYSSFRLDSIIEPDKKIKYDVFGVRNQAITVDVPTIHTIEVKVNFTKVAETNSKGKEWDYNLFRTNKTDTYPDLIYTIESTFNMDSRGIFGGQFYKAHKQKNTVISSWPFFSDLIYYCEGDELSICIKDADTLIHDNIGCITISKLLSLDDTSELRFDSVLSFSCDLNFK